MRRIPAIVLLLVAFSLSLISPLLLAGQQKELPACCRRDGKHHCGKQMGQPPADGVQIGALSTCPLFPNGKVTPAPNQTGATPPTLTGSNVTIPVHAAPPAQPAQQQPPTAPALHTSTNTPSTMGSVAMPVKQLGSSELTVCVISGRIAGFTEMLLGLASKMV